MDEDADASFVLQKGALLEGRSHEPEKASTAQLSSLEFGCSPSLPLWSPVAACPGAWQGEWVRFTPRGSWAPAHCFQLSAGFVRVSKGRGKVFSTMGGPCSGTFMV